MCNTRKIVLYIAFVFICVKVSAQVHTTNEEAYVSPEELRSVSEEEKSEKSVIRKKEALIDTCYNEYTVLGDDRYTHGQYQQAYYNYLAAEICKNKPANNNLADLQKRAKNALDLFNKAKEFLDNEDYLNAIVYFSKLSQLNANDIYSKKMYQLCLKKISGTEKMAYVEGGLFNMGSTKCADDAQPVHEVWISRFYIDIYEVTNEEFTTFLNLFGNQSTNGIIWIDLSDNKIKQRGNFYYTEPGFEKHPVVRVNWYGADAYAKWLGKRLPTEAEWEFASKGGIYSKNYLYSGGNIADSVAWYKNNSLTKTYQVGLKKPNELGIYDMSGNAWEWCSDWYGQFYYNYSEDKNPKGTNAGEFKVARGGSALAPVIQLSSAYRNFNYAEENVKTFGFRCVKDL